MRELKKVDIHRRIYRGQRTVNFNKAGGIFFSKAMTAEAGIQSDDCISFFYDPEKPLDWFLRIHPEADLPIKGDEGYLRIYSSTVRKMLDEALKLDPDINYIFPIGKEVVIGGLKYWPIITAKHAKP